MSSIMRRRRGLISAIGGSPVLRVGLRHPQSSQTGDLPLPASCTDRASDGLAAEAIPARAAGARGEYGDAVGAREYHELSSRNRDRRGTRGGRIPVSRITPPQQGQRPGSCRDVLLSASGVLVTVAVSSRLRQSASLAARWPLARKP